MARILTLRPSVRATQRYGVVVLAAGASRRLGRSKALVMRAGKSLVRHQVERAMAAGASWIGVALGCRHEQVLRTLTGLPVTPIRVLHWRGGMGESIAAAARRAPRGLRLLIVATDQWSLHAQDFKRLAAAPVRVTRAAHYHDVVGIPAAFCSSDVPRLQRLRGDRGARDLLRRAQRVSMPNAAPDLDTRADWRQLDRAWPTYRRLVR